MYYANGNQTKRTIGSDVYDLAYDAENRLVEVKKNNSVIAAFVYDGDGKRVKSESYDNNAVTETILFVGSHYEVKNPGSGESVSKYYFAGTSRIAMRKYTIPQNMSVEYTLGDHLGSTSITTDMNGVKISEMRYKPLGEIRYTWKSSNSALIPFRLCVDSPNFHRTIFVYQQISANVNLAYNPFIPMTRPLSVFLCHASQDKPAVRDLYKRLSAEKWIDPWLDEENLLPGQDFDFEINKALRDVDAIIICLSKNSVVKEGYVNKEIRRALDVADEKPEGAIYVIPLRLDECEPSFERLKKLHWADYFIPNAHEKLLKSLRARAVALKIELPENVIEPKAAAPAEDILDLHHFIQIPAQADSKISHPFWIGKYPVTNSQYERFLNAPDFSNMVYWLEFLKFDEACQPMGNWGKTGFTFLQEELAKVNSKTLLPRFWEHKDFGRSNPHHPVVGISWYEASAYCEWLLQNWDRLPEGRENPQLKPQSMRLPLEAEWTAAAGGGTPAGRYPWDEAGNATTSLKMILQRANVEESGVGHTMPVNTHPLGKSPFGVMDMAGNVWEWQANFFIKDYEWLAFRGGSWYLNQFVERVSGRQFFHISRPNKAWNDYGFRVAAFPGK